MYISKSPLQRGWALVGTSSLGPGLRPQGSHSFRRYPISKSAVTDNYVYVFQGLQKGGLAPRRNPARPLRKLTADYEKEDRFARQLCGHLKRGEHRDERSQRMGGGERSTHSFEKLRMPVATR